MRSRKAAGLSTAGPRFVVENTIIDDAAQCEVRALSPSSASVERAMAEIASMLPERLRPHLRVRAPSSNEASVVLWIKGLVGTALLGADLERQRTDDRGWGAVLALDPAAGGRASIIKVPHHGSSSGHDQRMWDELLEDQPAAVLTPWSRGTRRLPSAEDCNRICRLAPAAAIAGGSGQKPDRYVAAVERTLNEVAGSRRRATGRMGHIRSRCGPSNSGKWNVELIRDARYIAAAA